MLAKSLQFYCAKRMPHRRKGKPREQEMVSATALKDAYKTKYFSETESLVAVPPPDFLAAWQLHQLPDVPAATD